MAASTKHTHKNRDTFNSRLLFLMAAIGSAVGLGNIWRFPYIAFDNGGGAFLIPYLVALLTAGVPILWFDYTIGHRWRASAPLALRRIARWLEPLGWFKVGVPFFIAIYYAAIIAWAGIYMVKSFTKAWGDDPEAHLVKEFLKVDSGSIFSGDFIPSILWVMVGVWVLSIITLAMNVNKGIGMITMVFVPVLVVLFAIMVVRALFLPGAIEGLNAFFTPDWSKLSDPSVWMAAYGQIFFSLSVGFGIMITYASYLKPRTNLTGTGLVTAFANSSFEVLAGIGVFATLGFMAHNAGTSVQDVAGAGITLAFVTFPTIINQMPFGAVFGVLFFGSLFLAGITSLISIMEVPFAAVREKFNFGRASTAIVLGSVMAVLSCTLFATTSGLMILDIMDNWTNQIGIMGCAVLALTLVPWVAGRRKEIVQHLNAVSSVRVGRAFIFFAFIVTPLALAYMLVMKLIELTNEPYGGGDYTSSQLLLYGWAVIGAIVVFGFIMPFLPYKKGTHLDGVPGSDYGVPAKGRPAGQANPLAGGVENHGVSVSAASVATTPAPGNPADSQATS